MKKLCKDLPNGKYLIRASRWDPEHFEAIVVFKNMFGFYYDRKPGCYAARPRAFFKMSEGAYQGVTELFNDYEWLLGNKTICDENGIEKIVKDEPDAYPVSDKSGTCIETKTYFCGKWTTNRFCNRDDKFQKIWDFLYENLVDPYFELEKEPLPFKIEWIGGKDNE